MAGLGALGGGGLFAGKSLAVLAAGVLAGAVGGSALVASGTVQFGGQGGSGATGTAGESGLPVVACPDQGPVIGSIPRNQQVLVTGRSADGGWLQLQWPVPGIQYAWTKAGPLQLQGDAATLPIARCEAPPAPTARPTVEPTTIAAATPVATPVATAPPTAAPTAKPTARPTATPKPTATPRPTPTPIPTPTPKPNTGPVLSKITVSTSTISFDPGGFCPTAPKSVTFSVSASDPDGVASVTLLWRKPGTAAYAKRSMTLSGGKYSATLDTKADGVTTAGRLTYYVIAADRSAAPKSTRSPASGSLVLAVNVCANAGPTLTVTASPSSIMANPLNVGCTGSTLSEITAQASDPNGVTSVRLFYTRPGYRGTTSRDFTRDGDTWRSFINTVDSVDAIARPGAITWYAVATDGTGLTTQSPAATIAVGYCDSPASFDFSGLRTTGRLGPYNSTACGSTDVGIPVYASDPDNKLAGDSDSSRVSVVVTWSTTSGQSGRAQADFLQGNQFLASFSVAGWTPGGYAISWFATSTDIWGGTTKSFTANSKFTVLDCQPAPSYNPGSVPGGMF